MTFLGSDIADSFRKKGSFQWGGENFSESAEDITFAIEGSGVPILRAGLRNLDGELVYRDINLAERIGNNDGNFDFREYFVRQAAKWLADRASRVNAASRLVEQEGRSGKLSRECNDRETR